MPRPMQYEDRYPLFVNFVCSCWNETAIHPTIPEAADEWVALGNDGMIRILDRELRHLLEDDDILTELAHQKRTNRLGVAWGGRLIDANDVRKLAEHIGGIIKRRSIEPGWWERSKREMDWYLETEKQRPR